MRISADNFSLTLGKFHIDNVSLEIPDGSIFSIIGETGSGKSILLESLAGFYEPASGSINYDEVNVRQIRLEDRKIGYVYQDYSLFPHMSVLKNIEFGLKMHRVSRQERRERAFGLMEMLNISHLADRYPATLSGGEQQRTALARALILEPEVLFMDEPFSALDPNTKQNMYKIIEDVHRRFSCTIVFVTHDFNEATRLAENIGIMMHGCLKCVCRADNMLEMDHDPEVAGFLGIRKASQCQ